MDPVALAVIGLGLVWYVRAVRRVHRAGGRWPASRSIAAATRRDRRRRSPRTAGWPPTTSPASAPTPLQHVLLALVVPLERRAGRAAEPGPADLDAARPAPSCAGGRRCARLQVLAHPVVAGALFTATIVAMYATPLFAWSLTTPPVHLLVHAHLVLVGLLFFWPLVGFDPAPVRVPHPARVGCS